MLCVCWGVIHSHRVILSEKKKKKEEIKGFIGLECSLGIRRVLIWMLISRVYL